jgi:D-alanine-D-alanine ligase-like ATP-grasp enzyme/acylphosphatase
MNEGYPYWLSKQMLSGVRRFDIDSFLVALEGWRRGLSLKFYYDPSTVTDLKIIGYNQIGKTFSLSSEEKTHYFYRTRGDKVSNEATDIGTDKARAKDYLLKANVPTPEGFTFNKAMEIDVVIKKALELGFPLVIKPTLGSLGKGVVTDIRTEEYLRESIAYCFSEFDYEDFIIERHVEGEDVRVYVIEDEVVGAIKRTPANVTGDGKHSIDELIDQKNEKRKLNLQTSTRLIKKDKSLTKFLNNQSLTLEYIPEKGKTIFLKGQSNISSGGDSVDATNKISTVIKKTAVQAVKEIPGLNHAGVDLIVNDDGAFIIEINSTAGISLHVFPVYGKYRNIAENIIDFYFPETKGKAVNSTKIYFDYKNILELLRSNSVKQLEIGDAPVGELYAKRYVVSGEKVQKVGYRKWIRKQAIAKGLHGYTRNLNNGKVVVVVAGVEKNIVDEFKKTCYEGPVRAKVSDIQEYLWDKQIRVGFEIRKQMKKS